MPKGQYKAHQPVYPGSPRVGLGNVGSYQVSGVPYITSSCGAMTNAQEFKVQFPYVTKSITVIQSGSSGTDPSLFVHFHSKDDGHVMDQQNHHYITLNGDGNSVTLNVKCKEIYVTAQETPGFELFAELTNIPTSSMYTLTGSGLTSP